MLHGLVVEITLSLLNQGRIERILLTLGGAPLVLIYLDHFPILSSMANSESDITISPE